MKRLIKFKVRSRFLKTIRIRKFSSVLVCRVFLVLLSNHDEVLNFIECSLCIN